MIEERFNANCPRYEGAFARAIISSASCRRTAVSFRIDEPPGQGVPRRSATLTWPRSAPYPSRADSH